jgi:2-keto-3-deoxy-L-rhamnonate aldolase RhmA
MTFQPPRGFKSDAANDVRFGVLLAAGSIQVAELSAMAGADFLFVDFEHGEDVSPGFAFEVIRAADCVGTPVVVRVPENSPAAIGYALDHGAVGICVPHIRTKEDAERLVANCRYAPDGVRGMYNLSRAAGYSMPGGKFTMEDWGEYWRTANEEVMVIALVEDRIGLENVDEIAAVPGVDALWIGIGDLSQDLGVAGVAGDTQVAEAQTVGLAAAHRHGKLSFTVLLQSPGEAGSDRSDQVKDKVKEGYDLIAWVDILTYGLSLGVLLEAARADPS